MRSEQSAAFLSGHALRLGFDSRGAHQIAYKEETMDSVPSYKADPADFDLSSEVADLLYQVYVVDVKSMEDAIRTARTRTGSSFRSENGRRFIRANGWKRSPQFYSKRSPFQGKARAAIAETRAKHRTSKND